MIKSGVYKLSWSNGYFYIGQAYNLVKRWNSHKNGFLNGNMRRNQLKLYNVWNKYGTPDFKVIIYSPLEYLDDVEQSCIDINWGNSKLCNLCPSVKSNKGVKRSSPAWNKGVAMTKKAKDNLSIKMKEQGYKGEKHPFSKINESIVNEIRNKYIPHKYTAKKLAKEYNISLSHVWRIINKVNWTHI